MKIFRLIITASCLMFVTSACSSDDEKKELKSPCVSAPSQSSQTPCSPRIRVNDHWMS